MAPRDPNRSKASDIGDGEFLSACQAWTIAGAPWPLERFEIKFPKKVVAAKVAKVRTRGWIDAKLILTKAGVEALDKFEQEEAGA